MNTGRNSTNLDVTQVTSDILSEFLEVAFHSILYTRELYPAGIFERRKKYNVPIQMSTHPDVNQYIIATIQSLKPLLDKHTADRVCMTILDGSSRPTEKFVFEIASATACDFSEDMYLVRLEDALRAFLLKLNICDAILTTNPQECSWCIQVHTTEIAYADMKQTPKAQEFTWVEAEREQTYMGESSMLPLKSVDNAVVKMQLYVEENTSRKKT
ncbi:unnamed protein product [Owenia fusiformis]|uniref:Mitotic spindle assembly checkpoint protein MAD2B n=1 Tax=Owenia fusiformis TaxID=6347 RepID=A0A8J1UTT6_OWEFU|nr:unnamed protein product [Owenia fusiformis]